MFRQLKALVLIVFLSLSAIASTTTVWNCKKVLAFFALQTTTVDGEAASYLGESTLEYQKHFRVTLASIKQNSHSIIPVVVVLNPLPRNVAQWVKALGGIVVQHDLTIADYVLETAKELEWSWIKGVISTYLRIEVHLVLDRIRDTFEPGEVDTEYVIWGDLDTIWLKNFDSCSIAKPTLISVAGAGTNDPNAGIAYYNTTALRLIYGDMVKYGRSKNFKFSALDNTLMAEFAGQRFTSLPYFYNWRPYWGDVPKKSWTRDAGGEIIILHIHGPKLDKALCVLNAVAVDGTISPGLPWTSAQQLNLKKICPMAHHQDGAFMDILETAYAIDGGRLYRFAKSQYDQLFQATAVLFSKQMKARYNNSETLSR